MTRLGSKLSQAWNWLLGNEAPLSVVPKWEPPAQPEAPAAPEPLVEAPSPAEAQMQDAPSPAWAWQGTSGCVQPSHILPSTSPIGVPDE